MELIRGKGKTVAVGAAAGLAASYISLPMMRNMYVTTGLAGAAAGYLTGGRRAEDAVIGGLAGLAAHFLALQVNPKFGSWASAGPRWKSARTSFQKNYGYYD